IPEPDRGRRRWDGKQADQKRLYDNRRRVGGERGKRLQKLRSELTERSFAHLYETGGMRRVHLKGRENILKRLVVHAAAFNLGLVMRKMIGVGKPRRLQGTTGPCFGCRFGLRSAWECLWRSITSPCSLMTAWLNPAPRAVALPAEARRF
ncbi:MAG: hypothetical protein GY953_25710, partial [bacterium]|nr:hypothetical protein [bacterium]